MIIPHALANRLNVFRERGSLTASLSMLTGIALASFFRPTSSGQICRTVTTLRINYRTLVNPTDKLATVWKIMFLILVIAHKPRWTDRKHWS
jgi:uncharacterized membrane protein YdjX (TVP38/TMEM64 family)